MSVPAGCVMLIDDSEDDNFFHERVIRKFGLARAVVVRRAARSALEYLTDESGAQQAPDIIFLDVNMPGMNGWEFLDAFAILDDRARGDAVIVMLTTSVNPDDEERARRYPDVFDFRSKPLTREILEELLVRLRSRR